MTYEHSKQYAHELKKKIAIKLNMTSVLLELDSLEKALTICEEGLMEITGINDSIYVNGLSVIFHYNIGRIFGLKGEPNNAIESVVSG